MEHELIPDIETDWGFFNECQYIFDANIYLTSELLIKKMPYTHLKVFFSEVVPLREFVSLLKSSIQAFERKYMQYIMLMHLLGII